MLDCKQILHDKYETFWSHMNMRYSGDPTHYSSKFPYPAIKDFCKFCQVNAGGKSVLDIGCGNGKHAQYFSQHGFMVSGIDISETAIKFCRHNAQAAKLSIDYQVGNILTNPYQANSFDIIIDSGCFHHLRKVQWSKYKSVIKKLIKPGGYYFLLVFSRQIPAIKRMGRKNTKLSWSTHNEHYYHFFTKEEVKQFFQSDFKMIKWYNFNKGDSPIIFNVYYLQNKE